MSSHLQNSNSDNCGNIITFRAIHSYKGNVSKCQLSFQKGDIIVCNAAHVSENDPASGGWLWGCIENGPSSTSRPAAVGWFPPKYVQRFSSPVRSISPPVPTAAVAEVDDPFAGLPLLSSTSTVGTTHVSAITETVREPEEKSIASPDIAEIKNETIIPASDETHSFQFTDGDEHDHDDFGDFDGGIQPEITIENEAVLDDKVASKGVLALPSPETFVDLGVETNDIVNEAPNEPPSLPFAGDTAAATANSDQDTDISALRSDELNLFIPTDPPSESKLSDSRKRCFDPENEYRVRREHSPTTLPEESGFNDGTFDSTTANSLSKFDKNTALECAGKISTLELPSPEKLGILINRLDIDKGIIPDIPFLDNDKTLEDDPANGVTFLKDDETNETDSNGKPSSSAINKFIRIDSSISKLESFHSVRESMGTAAEDSSREINDNELGKLEEDNPMDTSPPGQFFDAVEDEEELNGTGQIKELYSDEEKNCIAVGNSNQVTFMDSKSVGEGQRCDEDEFGDFNCNESPSKQQLSLATSDDFGSFDGGFLSSPISGNLNDGISVSNGKKALDYPVVLDDISLPSLSEYRSSDVGGHNPDSSSIFLGNTWKADQNVMVDDGLSEKNYGAQPDVESSAVKGVFVTSEAPSWHQERNEDILFCESIDENDSSKSISEIAVKDAAMLHVPISSEALAITQIQSIFSGSTENIVRSLSGDISVDKRKGENADDSSRAPLELPSPEKLISVVETRKASKQVPKGDSEADIEEFPSDLRQNSDSSRGNEDLKGRNFGFFFRGDEKAENNHELDLSEHGQVIGGKTSISNAFELPSPDKLGIYVEASGANNLNSLHLPFSVVPKDDTEPKFDNKQPVNDANGGNMNNNTNEKVDDASGNGTGSNNSHAYHFQSLEELDFFIETTATGLKDTLSENFLLSQIDVGQKSNLGDKSASGNDSDDGFGEFSDGLALASPSAEYVDTTGAQVVNSSQLPVSVVPDGSLGKFDEVQSVNGTNCDNMNDSKNEQADDADSTRSRTKNNQACCFQSLEELDLFIETTATRLKDPLSENSTFSQIDAGQKSNLGDKSASGNDSDDGFGEFSDGLALASPSAEHDSTTVRPNTLSSGGVSPNVVERGCRKNLEEQPEEFGHCIEHFSEANLFDGDAIHPVVAKEALEANEGKVDFLPSMTSTATDDIEFSAFPETATWIDDTHTNDIATSPKQSCVLPHFQIVSKELSGDLKVSSLEILESSAEIQASSNQRLDEVTQEFDEFGDFGSASFQQLKSDACTVKSEMDDAEFGDFADFDEAILDMPQGETVPYPDTKSNFDESDFGDFSGDFVETQEIPDGNVLNPQDQEWIIAAQEVMESIFPMPDFTFSCPTVDYRPPSLSDILELDSDPEGSRPDPTTLWSERSLQQCFQNINQRSDTSSRIICVPVAPSSFFPIMEEQETKGYKKLEESLSLEPAFTF